MSAVEAGSSKHPIPQNLTRAVKAANALPSLLRHGPSVYKMRGAVVRARWPLTCLSFLVSEQ
jgi:hypothetical protein